MSPVTSKRNIVQLENRNSSKQRRELEFTQKCQRSSLFDTTPDKHLENPSLDDDTYSPTTIPI